MDSGVEHLAQSVSTTCGRMPLSPLARALARSSIMARVSASVSGSPTPQAWERTRLTCSCADLLGGNAHGGEFAEAGVDAVGGLAGGDEAIDDRARGLHALDRVRVRARLSRRASATA